MSLLWVRAASGESWGTARNRSDMGEMTRHKNQVAKAHGVPGFRAGIALRPIYQALGRGSINDNIQPEDAGFASGPSNDSDGNLKMPWSDDHPLTDHENWHHVPVGSVPLKNIHATQEGVNARGVAHNLFHPGKLPPVSWPGQEHSSEIGDPDVDPDSHDHAERAEAIGADEASKVPRFYRDKTGKTYVADGHHQVAAALLLKKPSIQGRVWDESSPPEGVR